MCGRWQDSSRKVKNFRKDAHIAEISILVYDPLVAHIECTHTQQLHSYEPTELEYCEVRESPFKCLL